MSSTQGDTQKLQLGGWIAALCFFIVVFEGYDIVALGATIPVLTDPNVGGFSVSQMNWVNTFSLIGVGAGAA